MSHTREEKIEALGRVIDTLDRLRVECPWDRKQTNRSLRPNTIEEVFELCDALILDDDTNTCDVADKLNAKLIFRHPHIFGDVKVNNSHDVELNWEQIKLREKGGNKTVLAGVPAALPALIKAFRIQEKAANVGFDWDSASETWDKVKEEIAEFSHEAESMSKEKMEAEFGDVLFSLINVGRKYGIEPENALELTNKKFISRFNYVESAAKEKGMNLKEMSLEEMDELWNEAKSIGK